MAHTFSAADYVSKGTPLINLYPDMNSWFVTIADVGFCDCPDLIPITVVNQTNVTVVPQPPQGKCDVLTIMQSFLNGKRI